MSAPEKLVGAGALIMATCCAVLPLTGAALGGGLIAGAGTIGLIAGIIAAAAAAVYAVTRRREPGGGC